MADPKYANLPGIVSRISAVMSVIALIFVASVKFDLIFSEHTLNISLLSHRQRNMPNVEYLQSVSHSLITDI